MLGDGCIVVEEQFLPVGAKAGDFVAVGIDNIVGVGIEGSQSVLYLALILQDGIVDSSGHVALLPRRLPARAEVVVDLCFADLSLLRGDENDAVGSPCTVDGARGSILQHFHTLDVLGVHAFHTVLVGRHAVDNIKRFRVVDGTDTTDTDERLGARLARGRGDLHAGSHTLQRIFGAQACLAFQVVGAHFGNRCRDDALLLHAVANDHHVLQRVLVFPQGDGHAVGGLRVLSGETNVRESEHGSLSYFQHELTIHVSDGTVFHVCFFYDRGTNHGLTCLVDDRTRHVRELSTYRRRKKHGKQGECYSPHRG